MNIKILWTGQLTGTRHTTIHDSKDKSEHSLLYWFSFKSFKAKLIEFII